MQIEVQKVEADQRLDLFLRQRCPELSRSWIQTLIKDGEVSVTVLTCVPPISCRLVIA